MKTSTSKHFRWSRMTLVLLAAFLLTSCNMPARSTPAPPTPWDRPPSTAPSTPIPETPKTAPPATPTETVENQPLETSGEDLPKSLDIRSLDWLVQFEMITPEQGWATTGPMGVLLHTADGGRTWNDVSPEGYSESPSSSLEILDASTAFTMVFDSGGMDRGVLMMTTDGGQSWTASETPFGYATLDFLDGQTGWGLVDRGVAAGSNAVDIYQTSDGGASWNPLFQMDPENPGGEGNLPLGGLKGGLSFVDPQNGWLSGVTYAVGEIYVFKTSDGGSTWQPETLYRATGFEEAMYTAHPPVFFSAQNGILRVEAFAGSEEPQLYFIVYTTTDGGQTWELNPPVRTDGTFSAPSPDDWYTWADGSLYATHDAGQSWNEIPANLPAVEAPHLLSFATAEVGWALFQNEAETLLYQTRDSGQSWIEIVP